MERRAMDLQPLDLYATVQRVLDEFGADIDRCRAERPQLLNIGGIRIACHAVEEGRI